MTKRVPPPMCFLARRTRHFAFLLRSITAVGLCQFLPLSIDEATRAAEVAAAEEAVPSIVYRRIFVPAENVDAWPREGDKYLPIESREFEALLEAANNAQDQTSDSASISEAHYSARLEDDRLVAGRGQWHITLHGDEPGLLPLGDTSLVVRGARWQKSPQRPARLGTWGKNGDSADTAGLEVTEAGILEFDWEASSKSTHDGIEIPWKLPIATTTKVILDLPEGKEPHMDGGVVIKSELLKSASDNTSSRRWELACNASHASVLRILDVRPTAMPEMPDFSLREDVGYQITQRGVDIVATWYLDDADANAERRELVLPLPRGVQLMSAVADGHDITWRVINADLVDRAVFEIAQQAARRPLQITLRAWHPLFLDRPWQLPKLRPEGVFWTSGDIEVSIAKEMEMCALTPRGCVEIGVSAIADAATGPETWRLAAFSPTAEVEVTVERRPTEATVRMGSTLALADPDISGRMVTQWNVARGSVHRLSADVAPGWVVEAVETVPADALREWFIDRREGRKRIEIQLARGVSAAHEVTVIINGRLQRSAFTDRLSAETIRMVKWRGARVAEHLLTFQTTDPYAVEPFGTLPETASDKIGDDQALVESDALDGIVFDLAQAREGAGLKLIVKPGQYTADIRLDATLIRQELRQAHHLVITPSSNRVDRLLIYSTVPLGDQVEWTGGQSHELLSAERLPKDHPAMEAVPAGGELWIVRLPRPTTRAVDIAATTARPWPTRSELPLLAMPEATEQLGRVFVRNEVDDVPLLEPHNMPAIPLPLAAGDSPEATGKPPISAAYRFDPMSCLEAIRAPQLRIGPGARRDGRALIARRVALESFFSPHGNASHRATYYLENQGAGTFDVRLPLGAVLETVSVDGRGVNQPVASASGEVSPIRLPSRTGPVTVSISFGTRQSPLAAGSTLIPPVMETQTPVLVGEWTIRLPDEFSVSTAADLNWRQRLFGPLGRPNGQRPFQPLRAADWAMLVNSMTLGRSGVSSSGSPPGWHVYHTMFIAEQPSAVHIAHAPATTTWAVSIFLLCLVGGVSIARRRNDTFLVLLALAAALALLLPAVFAPMATGAVMGLLFSLVAPTWRRRYELESGASTYWSKLSTVGVLALATAFSLSMTAFGQQTDATNSSDRSDRLPSIHRLFIPVDAEGRPAGTKYYVSERFFRELMRSASEQSSLGAQWLLRDMNYTGELRERAEPSGIVAGEWTIECDVEVLARDTTVVLPLVREEAIWHPSAMLDGVPTPLVWREDASGCAIEIAEPGRYSLVITCVPRTSVSRGRNLVTLTIPPHRGATFRINHPSAMADVTVSEAQSEPATGAADALKYQLNDTNKLEVQWPAVDMSASGKQDLRVTELRWLRIGADSVELDSKYILEGIAPRPKELIVAFSRGWELVQDEKPLIEASVEVESVDRSLVRLPLPPNVAARQEVLLRWRLTTGAPLGRLRLPDIGLISIPITQRWRGLSTVATLVGEVVDGSAQPGSVAEFQGLWGDNSTVDAPQIVLGNVEASYAWTVIVTPRQIEPEIDEVLQLAVGSDTLRVVYEANVVPGNDHKYQFPLTVPADLSIGAITVMQAEKPVPLRWARVAENRVNVFFSEEIAEEYQIALHGSMPADSPGMFALPWVGAADISGAGTIVHLYRDENVTIDARGLPQDAERLDSALELPPASWTARHVGSYRLDEPAADKVRLDIQPNHPELTGDTLTTLQREPDGWLCEFQCDLSVEEGLLGTLQLRAPATWAGPFTHDSTVPASVEVALEDNQPARLLIRFSEPLAKGSAVNVRIRSPLTLAAASSVSVPEIVAEPDIRRSHYVRVPASVEGRPIAWHNVGVREMELPKKHQPSSDALAASRSFEVVTKPFEVTLQPPVKSAHGALVRLADTTVSSDEAGRQLILTWLVVEPNGAADCTLRLPRDQELVAVRLDGRPALIRPASPADWRVPLGPPQMPCVLEIVSRSIETPSNLRYGELRRPVLLSTGKPIPVEINLWSFGFPLTLQHASIAVASEVSAVDQAVLRFDRLLGIAETATPAAIESPPPDGSNWYRPWASMLKTLRQESLEKMAEPLDRQVASQVSRPLEEQLIEASGRLDQWIEQCNEMLADRELDASSQESTTHTLFAAPDTTQLEQSWVYCVTDGGLDRLIIHFAPDSTVSTRFQPVGLVALFSLLAAAILLVRSPVAQDFFYRWPHAIGFVTGVAYWAWLRPSWLGLLIAAAFLALAWRPGWPGRALRLEDSTVLRVSRPK